MHKSNIKKLREIDRTIVAVIVMSSDGKILLGKKDPKKVEFTQMLGTPQVVGLRMARP